MAQMARCCCGESAGAVLSSSGIKRRSAPSTVAGVPTSYGEAWALAGQFAAELVHEPQRILGGLVGQMQIDHGGGDLFMAQELLDGVQMRAGFQQMGGKGMAQRMHRSGGNVELFAGHDDQPLQGGTGHGRGGRVHASGQRLRGVVVAAADVGEEQERVAVKGPVAAQFLLHGGGQRHDPVLVALALANEQLVFLAFDVVDGRARGIR